MPLADVGLVILDFDGVVADSEVLSLSTLQDALAEYGMDVSVDTTRDKFLGKSLATIIDYVAAHSPRASADGFEEHWQGKLFNQFRQSLRPTALAICLIDHLDAVGLPYCIASSSTFERLGIALMAMGLTDRFDHVFSAEQVDHGKPAPDLFLHAAAAMGHPPKACLVIEDSPYGAQAAKSAGMRCVGYVGGRHLEGIVAEHSATLRKAGADFVVDTHTKLIEMGLATGKSRT